MLGTSTKADSTMTSLDTSSIRTLMGTNNNHFLNRHLRRPRPLPRPGRDTHRRNPFQDLLHRTVMTPILLQHKVHVIK